MAKLNDHIENVLNEARMLLLGGQVLLGFSYRICFEPVFEKLSPAARLSTVTALGLMTAGLGWLIWPAAFHQIAERGRLTESVHTFTTRVLDWALLPFAAGLGLTLYPVCLALRMPHPAVFGACASLLALTLWYGWGILYRRNPTSTTETRRHGENQHQVLQSFDYTQDGLRGTEEAEVGGGKIESSVHEKQSQNLYRRDRGGNLEVAEKDSGPQDEQEGQDISDRIKKVLIECRMALPGAQAFLGFQFSIVFTQAFFNLPHFDRLVHFCSLLATTIAIVLLIAPAAYHRLAEGGEDTEHFQKVASRLLLASLVFLAPGMAGDLYIVLKMVTNSSVLAGWIAPALLLVFYSLWFGGSWWRRQAAIGK